VTKRAAGDFTGAWPARDEFDWVSRTAPSWCAALLPMRRISLAPQRVSCGIDGRAPVAVQVPPVHLHLPVSAASMLSGCSVMK